MSVILRCSRAQLGRFANQHARVSARVRPQVFPSKDIMRVRRLCTKMEGKSDHHRPPRLIRALLVGSSVGLATPAFVIMGTFQMWWRVAPKTGAGRAAKFIVGSLIGGGSLTLVYEYIGPFLRDHSEIVLPFALANALSSGFWYTLSEAVFGLEVLMGSVSAVAVGTRVASVTDMVAGEQVMKFVKKLPLAGTAVGVLTAVTAPVLWPMMFDICWGSSLRELILGSRDVDGPSLLRSNWLVDAYSNFTLPLAVPVGAVAGATMHTVLQPVVLGTPGKSWTRTSLPPLMAVMCASALYFTFSRSAEDDWWWEQRVDPRSGTVYSYNHNSGESSSDGGHMARKAAIKRGFLGTVAYVRSVLATVRRIIASEMKENGGRGGGIAADDAAAAAAAAAGGSSSGGIDFPFPLRSLDGVDATLRSVHERAALFELVDVMMRLKQLDLLLADPPVGTSAEDVTRRKKQRAEVLQLAKDSRLCKDIATVLKATEVGIVVSASSPSPSSSSSWGGGGAKDEDGRLRDVRLALQAQAVPHSADLLSILTGTGASRFAASRAEYRLALLHSNLPLVAKEMRDRMGYTPDSAAAAVEHRKLQAANFFGSTLFKSAVAAAAGGLVLLLSAGRQ